MGKTERYERILTAALKVRQLRYELKEQIEVIAENITAKELKSRDFENEDAQKAFLLLENVQIEESTHVGSKAIYKDIDVYLHSQVGSIGNKAMKEVLSDISNRQITRD